MTLSLTQATESLRPGVVPNELTLRSHGTTPTAPSTVPLTATGKRTQISLACYQGNAVAIQPDGKIVVAGVARTISSIPFRPHPL